MDKVLLALKGLYEDARKVADSPLSGVKRVYIGDPITIHENTLPALIVHPVRTSYKKRGTRYDEKSHRVDVKLVYNAKDYFGDEASGDKITISDAVFSVDKITYTTATDHGYSVGDGVFVTGSDPAGYNGTFEVATVVSPTSFEVAKSTDPETYVGSAIVQIGKTNSVFAVVDGVNSAEKTNSDRETVDNTICGLLEKNPKLNYASVNNADNVQIDDVNYAFGSSDRPFPSFEVIVPITVSVISNR